MINPEEKCVFCGKNELITSKVAFPEKRRSMSVSMSRDGSPSFIDNEFVDFSVKRCAACGYVHLFHFPDPFKRTTIE